MCNLSDHEYIKSNKQILFKQIGELQLLNVMQTDLLFVPKIKRQT